MNVNESLVGRRACLRGLAGLLVGTAATAWAASETSVLLGTLQFGTVQWVADVILRNHLDAQHGFVLQTLKLANTEAGRIALMASSADIIVSDWTMAATQRAAGDKLCFAPFSSAVGGVMIPQDSAADTLRNLTGRTLGVAGGPLDKSWLIVRSAGKAQGVDLESACRIVYGASPLLAAKLQQGELDAALTYWNIGARLEAAGFRQMLSVADCARDLGLPRRLGLLGFVFHEDWANQNRQLIDGFLAAAADAERRLADADAEWQAVRPLMDAANEAVFAILKRRFIEAIGHPPAEEEERTAERLLAILNQTGGPQAADGLTTLPEGVFWPVANADR